MGNPICPKCGKLMQTKTLLVQSRTAPTGQNIYGLCKFWVCPNKKITHGIVKFRRGAQTIPPYKGKHKK